MSPAINPGLKKKRLFDIIIANKHTSNIKNVKRRLVLMYHPFEGKLVVRYLLGTPGDWIKTRNNDGLFINVPSGHCWVECVNGDDDSNTWGFVRIYNLDSNRFGCWISEDFDSSV